jgi:hypothetical protein
VLKISQKKVSAKKSKVEAKKYSNWQMKSQQMGSTTEWRGQRKEISELKDRII